MGDPGLAAVAAFHRPEADYVGAILAGPDRAELEKAIGEVASRIRKPLFLDADESSDYSVESYLAACGYLLGHRLPLAQVLAYTDRDALAADPGRFQSVARAIEDLLWGGSTEFLRRLGEPGALRPDFCVRWGDHLAACGQPVHALKFYYFARGRFERAPLAKRVVECWLQVGGFEPLVDWIADLGLPKGGIAELRRQIEESSTDGRAEGERYLSKNLAAAQPMLRDRLAKACAEHKYLSVFLPAASWRMRLPAGRCEAAEWVTLLSLEGPWLREHNPLGDPRPDHETLARPRSFDEASAALVCLGGRYDRLINAVAARPSLRDWPGAEQAVYVVEKDAALLVELLRAVDLSEVFSMPRVAWFVGERAEEELLEFFADHPMRLIPEIRLGSDGDLDRWLDATQALRRDRAAEAVTATCRTCGPGFDAGLFERLAGNGDRPLRILFVTSRFTDVVQYCTRDLATAARRLGLEAHVFQEESSLDRATTPALADRVHDVVPDLVFLIDHLRPDLHGVVPPAVPVVSWLQDEVRSLSEPEKIGKLGPRDFTYALYSGWVEKFRRLGYPHIRFLPNAADVELYQPDETIRPVDQVAVVMNMGGRPADPPRLPGLFAWIERALEERGIGFQREDFYAPLLREGVLELGLRPSAEEFADVLFFVRLFFERWFERRRHVLWLVEAGFPVALYGRGWDENPEFRSLARGPMASGAPLARAYQESKVVLHVNNHYNCHQRVFECIAAGGFVLARRCPCDGEPGELADRLAIGTEIQVYSTKEELRTMVERAFRDEAWRRRTIELGRARVIAEHRYQDRLREVLADVRQTLRADASEPRAAGGIA